MVFPPQLVMKLCLIKVNFNFTKDYKYAKIPQLLIFACIVHLAARRYLIVNNGGYSPPPPQKKKKKKKIPFLSIQCSRQKKKGGGGGEGQRQLSAPARILEWPAKTVHG